MNFSVLRSVFIPIGEFRCQEDRDCVYTADKLLITGFLDFNPNILEKVSFLHVDYVENEKEFILARKASVRITLNSEIIAANDKSNFEAVTKQWKIIITIPHHYKNFDILVVNRVCGNLSDWCRSILASERIFINLGKEDVIEID